MRARDPKPSTADTAPTEPPKKRKKVKHNAWRLSVTTDREVPFYELSDYDMHEDDGVGRGAESSNNEQQSANSTIALNTDLPVV